MARKFLTALDLAKNELQNAAVQSLGSAPSAPVKFQLYGNTSDNTLYWWDGTQWIAAKAGGAIAFGSVPAETTFGLARADGVASTAARSDHTHGSPTHVNADHAAINLSALAAPTADINMGNFKITSLAAPLGSTDATNKGYVDNAIAGISWKDAVRAASTANRALSALTAMDGVTPAANDRILLKDQTAPAENGIWLAQSGAWTRALDADTGLEISGTAVFVLEGTLNADTAWVCTANDPITVGTTGLPFVQFAGGGAVTAGTGLTQSGNTINVIGDATMVITADQISQAPLTGDVTTPAGSNATTIAVDAVSNTKLANMAALTLKGNDTVSTADPKDLDPAALKSMLGYSQTAITGCAAATSTVFNHNLGSSVLCQVYRSTTPFDLVDADIERTTANSVTVRFTTAPTAGQYWIQVMG